MADRILVYGVTGSGKTTLAARISAATGVPWYAVDDLTWEPGWVEVPFDEQERRIARICSTDRWILDTAYSRWSADSILRWHFRSFARKRARIREWTQRAELDPSFARVVRLSSPRATRRWMACGCPGGTS